MLNIFAKRKQKKNCIYSFADGSLTPIENVNDEVFSKKVMGDGLAMKLKSDIIQAPSDGIISMMFPTMHAFGMKLDNGIELLIHIGLDTVSLKGHGFTKMAECGERVKKVKPIIKIDRNYIEKKGYDTTSLLIFVKTNHYKINYFNTGEVKGGKDIIAVYERSE